MKQLAQLLCFLIVVAMLANSQVDAQTVKAGISSVTGPVQLVISAKPYSALTGNASAGNITITWPASYGNAATRLGTVTSSVGNWFLNASGNYSGKEYANYAFVAPPTTNINWIGGNNYELFRVNVNSTGVGTGIFTLAPKDSVTGGNWAFEVGGILRTNTDTNYYQSSVSGVPLPVQLSGFAAAFAGSNQVKLTWTTLSETNCYGFEVQKSQGGTDNYQTLPNSFVAGNGTTLERHTYSYTDASAAPGDLYYRLKQTDKDGGVTYSDGIKPAGVTGVATEKPVPKVFALDQNYPNPFNPSTNIDFALPKDSHVKIEVYNIIGQRVATLVDEIRPVGYYTVSFNAANLASGIYLYRLTTNEVSFLKKMMLLK